MSNIIPPLLDQIMLIILLSPHVILIVYTKTESNHFKHVNMLFTQENWYTKRGAYIHRQLENNVKRFDNEETLVT